MSQVYSHRNGETEPPAEPGWYLFTGKIPGTAVRVYLIADIHHGGFFFGANLIDSTACQGRWWGPVTLPWEDE